MLDLFEERTVNSIYSLHWNDNLAAIFEAELRYQCQSLSIVFVGAVVNLQIRLQIVFKDGGQITVSYRSSVRALRIRNSTDY